MKTVFHGFLMCQSMFCAIPCPGNIWDEKAKDKMLLFLPLVGLEIGVLWALLAWLCRTLGLPHMMTALALSLFPYLATGFMHLDGFMDVSDAVKSYRSLERRREILKDSHVGSFAVVNVILLILAQFAVFASGKPDTNYWTLALIPVVSRCCSAFFVTKLPSMSTSQFADQKKPRWHLTVLGIMAAAALMAGGVLFGKYGIALLAAILGYLLALRRAYRSLEGMNGDIAGYALSLGELAGAAALVLL